MQLSDRRRFYAEELEATSNLQTTALVEALASVPRERFLPPGPWTVRGEGDFASPSRPTRDADARHVYHNFAIAIDPARQLFNGAPGLLALALDRLALADGHRVLHIGAGTGYYTALMARCVGPAGRVLAIEIDPGLADAARANLASMPWVEVSCADGTRPLDGLFDAVLINAGITHPLESWLDAVAPDGRMILPLTVALSPHIGKGPLLLLTRTADGGDFEVRVITFVAIYTAGAIRDATIEGNLGRALKANPMPPLTRLRCDAHDPAGACWLHGAGWCWSTS